MLKQHQSRREASSPVARRRPACLRSSRGAVHLRTPTSSIHGWRLRYTSVTHKLRKYQTLTMRTSIACSVGSDSAWIRPEREVRVLIRERSAAVVCILCIVGALYHHMCVCLASRSPCAALRPSPLRCMAARSLYDWILLEGKMPTFRPSNSACSIYRLVRIV